MAFWQSANFPVLLILFWWQNQATLSSLWCIIPMNKRCSLTLIHPASLTAHCALCICLENGWVSEEPWCLTPELSVDHTVQGHLIKRLVLPANAASQVSVNGCRLFLFFSFLFFLFLRVWQQGILALPQVQSTKIESPRTFMLLNKNYPCEWEKSMIPCKKVISQHLLMNQWTKESCHRLYCSCLLSQGWKFKEKVQKELDWESRHPDFC